MSSHSLIKSAGTLDKSAAQERSTKRVRQRALRADLTLLIFVGPLLLGLLMFTYIPVVWGVLLSFFEARNTITPTQFIGLQNYIDILRDPVFLKSMGTFILFAIFIVPTTFFGALGLALLVNSVVHGKGFFRSVFFIPTACSYVVASLVWKMSIFNGLPYGLANVIRSLFGLHAIPWVVSQNPPWYWLVLVTVRLWLQLGFYMILFLAGLQSIPQELYEAAYVDGAKKGWTTFRAITFPLLRNVSVAVLLLNLIAAFQAFDEFYNILGSFVGSSGNQILAQPPLVYLYGLAFGNQDYGLGSAGAIILALLIVAFTLIQGRVFGFGRSE
jgi:multiple sugar transport system permease protein